MSLLRRGHTQRPRRPLQPELTTKRWSRPLAAAGFRTCRTSANMMACHTNVLSPPDPPQPPKYLQGRDPAWSEWPFMGMQKPFSASSFADTQALNNLQGSDLVPSLWKGRASLSITLPQESPTGSLDIAVLSKLGLPAAGLGCCEAACLNRKAEEAQGHPRDHTQPQESPQLLRHSGAHSRHCWPAAKMGT